MGRGGITIIRVFPPPRTSLTRAARWWRELLGEHMRALATRAHHEHCVCVDEARGSNQRPQRTSAAHMVQGTFPDRAYEFCEHELPDLWPETPEQIEHGEGYTV